MAVPLLERDAFLHTLDDLLCQVEGGSGRIALVSGEAGIGKTSLVEHFLERQQSATRTLWGACEALFTPRPLGPLYDIVHQIRTPLRMLLEGEVNRATLFAAVLDELVTSSPPTIIVIEDIHWADEATLDLIKFLARRIHRTRALLIVTYRDEELGREHPLRLVLGDLTARDVTRLRLPPLSEAAVVMLAQEADRSANNLYLVTSGNPFFLMEILTSGAPGVPASVTDAVHAQITRRSPGAQKLLELVAVVPTKVERRVVEAASAAYSTGLEECLAAGILQMEDGAVGYRHEIARQAVENTLTPARRQALHAEVLRVLLESGGKEASLARLVHHAAQAEDATLVLRFTPAAARQASAQGAHREAAAYYGTALRYADSLDPEQRADLLDGLSYECLLTGQVEEAVQARMAALAVWRYLNHKEQIGKSLCQLSNLYLHLGRDAEAGRFATEAVELLETLPPGRELAKAYTNLSGLRMMQSDTAQTVLWGERAIDLAKRFHNDKTEIAALNLIGTSQMCAGVEGGQEKLELSLQMALEHGFENQVADTYRKLAANTVRHRAYTQATGYIEAGLAYCTERDLDSSGHGLRLERARACLDQGDWSGADEDLATVLRVPRISAVTRIPALTVLGLLRVRRGDPDVETVLDEARDLALATGEMQWITPLAAVRAEWRWLQGDHEGCGAEAEVGVHKASHLNRPWFLGEVAVWFWRGGRSIAALDEVAVPFAVQMSGDWRAAADVWERLGCPYEQALALIDGNEIAQRSSLAIFEQLGAHPAAALVRRQLRAVGVRGLPRGPRPTTRENPHGLTNRQMEILLLMAEGLSNPEIAVRLSTTPKTVEHHVSAVLAKLEARSRTEAVRFAYQLELVPQTVTPPRSKMGVS
ncbi:MAG: ATP-binding protein [Ktedonobacterales bacterium]